MTPVDLSEALAVLGLAPGASMAQVRDAYLTRVRAHHPDRLDPLDDHGEATRVTAEITSAFALLRTAVVEGGTGHVPEPPPPAPAPDPPPRPWTVERIDAAVEEGDTIHIAVPAPEAFGLLLDAGARLGGIGYVDRQLGIIEIIVRFEGGPSCSVLITLQGRAFGTDAFCTMDSIEAAPTPELRPVVEALVEELRRPR